MKTKCGSQSGTKLPLVASTAIAESNGFVKFAENLMENFIKMASRTAIFKRVGIKTLLCTLTALILALALHSVVSAYRSESQLIDDTQSTASSDSFAFRQTIELNYDWEVSTTTIEFDIDITGGSKDVVFLWFADAWTYSCAGAGYDFNVSTRTKKTIITSADCIEEMINSGWNTAAVRGWLVHSVGADVRFWGSSNPNSYPDGIFYRNWGTDPDPNVKDAYFEIEIGFPVNTIQIDFPEDTGSTPEFEVFLVSGNNIESAEDYRMLARVSFGTSSSSLNFCPGNFLSNENEEIGPFESHIYNWFLEQPLTTYYAQASLLYCPLTDPLECAFDPNLSCDNLGSYEIKATSTLISYFITGEEGIVGGGLPMPTSTATSSEWVMTCDPTDPLFTRSLCRLFQALFSPKQSDLNQFNDLRSALQNKPPMGYFGVIKEIFSGLTGTDTPAFILENASTTLAEPIFNPIKNGITFILWFLFAFWIFNRFRNFEL